MFSVTAISSPRCLSEAHGRRGREALAEVISGSNEDRVGPRHHGDLFLARWVPTSQEHLRRVRSVAIGDLALSHSKVGVGSRCGQLTDNPPQRLDIAIDLAPPPDR